MTPSQSKMRAWRGDGEAEQRASGEQGLRRGGRREWRRRAGGREIRWDEMESGRRGKREAVVAMNAVSGDLLSDVGLFFEWGDGNGIGIVRRQIEQRPLGVSFLIFSFFSFSFSFESKLSS